MYSAGSHLSVSDTKLNHERNAQNHFRQVALSSVQTAMGELANHVKYVLTTLESSQHQMAINELFLFLKTVLDTELAMPEIYPHTGLNDFLAATLIINKIQESALKDQFSSLSKSEHGTRYSSYADFIQNLEQYDHDSISTLLALQPHILALEKTKDDLNNIAPKAKAELEKVITTTFPQQYDAVRDKYLSQRSSIAKQVSTEEIAAKKLIAQATSKLLTLTSRLTETSDAITKVQESLAGRRPSTPIVPTTSAPDTLGKRRASDPARLESPSASPSPSSPATTVAACDADGVPAAIFPDSFKQTKPPGFWSRNWGKMLIGTLLIGAGIASAAFIFGIPHIAVGLAYAVKIAISAAVGATAGSAITLGGVKLFGGNHERRAAQANREWNASNINKAGNTNAIVSGLRASSSLKQQRTAAHTEIVHVSPHGVIPFGACERLTAANAALKAQPPADAPASRNPGTPIASTPSASRH